MEKKELEKIIEKKYNERLSEINCYFSLKEKRIKKKKVIILLLTVILIFIIPILVFVLKYGVEDLGWFESFDGMYKVELPMESPAKGGTLYIPNDWKFIEEDGWYMIQNDKFEVIAYEVNRGYYQYNSELRKSELINKEINPKVLEYDYLSLLFECISDGSNNCVVERNPLYYRISFQNTCTFEDNELRKRNYFKEYFFVNCSDESLLRKIDNSYVWGGVVNV